MYKAVVVDDEKIEREGINFLFQKHGIFLDTAYFNDGEEALNHIKAEGTDILFTDIKMPFMGGLELAEAVQEFDSDVKIIIFSAYDEFNYARRAIDLNVIHYLLKPIDEEEFCTVLSKVTEQLKAGKRKRGLSSKVYRKAVEAGAEYIMLNILRGEPVSYQDKTILKNAGICLGDFYYIPCFLTFTQAIGPRRDTAIQNSLAAMISYPSTYIRIDELRSLILLQSNSKIRKERLEGLAGALLSCSSSTGRQPLHIIVGEPFTSVHQGRSEYAFMEEISRHSFFISSGSVVYTADFRGKLTSSHPPFDIVVKITEALSGLDVARTVQYLDSLSDSASWLNGLTADSIKYQCAEAILSLPGKYHQISETMTEQFARSIYSAVTVDQLKTAVAAAVRKCSESVSSGSEIPNGIERALAVIHENYARNIGVDFIAQKVYLNQNYLSHIFKETMGISLTKYLTNYRLKMAKELLQSSNLKIGDVAKRTGFNSSSYFCLIFRNNFGISPMEFREKGIQDGKTRSCI
jgi:two-component system response regulator YesN